VRERIFEKFYRADSGKGDGAGLGMSIAHYIAKNHDGSLTLEENDNTNVFVVSLPKKLYWT